MGVAAQIPVLASMQAAAKEQEKTKLSTRQSEVAVLAIEGKTNKQIAERLGIAEQTVKNHLRRVFIKKCISRREQLARVLG